MFESGLEFLRADFHLHTQKDKEFSYSGEPNDFVKSYISALKQANISVGVITNHNRILIHTRLSSLVQLDLIAIFQELLQLRTNLLYIIINVFIRL